MSRIIRQAIITFREEVRAQLANDKTKEEIVAIIESNPGFSGWSDNKDDLAKIFVDIENGESPETIASNNPLFDSLPEDSKTFLIVESVASSENDDSDDSDDSETPDEIGELYSNSFSLSEVILGDTPGAVFTLTGLHSENPTSSSFRHPNIEYCDLNGDGYKDLILASVIQGGGTAVYIKYGSENGFSGTSEFSDSDVYDVKITNNYDIEGSSDHFFGIDLGCGNFNDDAFQDLVIEGRLGAYVIYGQSASLDSSIELTESSDDHGYYLSDNLAMGSHTYFTQINFVDYDGDGVQDLFLSSMFTGQDSDDNKPAKIIKGSSSLTNSANLDLKNDATIYTITVSDTDRVFAFEDVGDINGDDENDFLVKLAKTGYPFGAELYADLYYEQELYFLDGASVGSNVDLSSLASDKFVKLNSDISTAVFYAKQKNYSGDFNGDGNLDLVASYFYDDGNSPNQMVTAIWYGDGSGIDADNPSTIIHPASSSSLSPGQFRADVLLRVTEVSDVNGDDISDLIFNSAMEVGLDEEGYQVYYNHHLYVVYGYEHNEPFTNLDYSSIGDSGDSSGILLSQNSTDYYMFGTSVIADDVNGRGLPDIILSMVSKADGEAGKIAIVYVDGEAS